MYTPRSLIRRCLALKEHMTSPIVRGHVRLVSDGLRAYRLTGDAVHLYYADWVLEGAEELAGVTVS